MFGLHFTAHEIRAGRAQRVRKAIVKLLVSVILPIYPCRFSAELVKLPAVKWSVQEIQMLQSSVRNFNNELKRINDSFELADNKSNNNDSDQEKSHEKENEELVNDAETKKNNPLKY
ncbi:hypothetical protein TNCV_3070181 [Trichonephila clavipes]|nr:hypothetical protein TNCV_3070181 [Trichonephila clavipes]